MPQEYRPRGRIAAHADRETGEAPSARQVLAEGGEGVGNRRVGKGAKRPAHHSNPKSTVTDGGHGSAFALRATADKSVCLPYRASLRHARACPGHPRL